jgi:hypothetical protein
MKSAIWIYRIVGGRRDIVKIEIWEVSVLALLVSTHLLSYELSRKDARATKKGSET